MTATDNKSDQSSSLLEEQVQDNMQQLPEDDPPWLEGSEDSDDEWFFDSIHR